jgi:hypothetical protein
MSVRCRRASASLKVWHVAGSPGGSNRTFHRPNFEVWRTVKTRKSVGATRRSSCACDRISEVEAQLLHRQLTKLCVIRNAWDEFRLERIWRHGSV